MIYRATVGSSVTLVDAADENEAREFIGTKLGYAHKRYLWDGIALSTPTDDQLERDKALGLKVVKATVRRDPSEGRSE